MLRKMQPNGEYHGGDYIFVPTGNQIDESIRLHEFSHQYLMKATHWGIMTYLQTQLRRADRLYSRLSYHFAIGNMLMHAAETTFESHATMNQLLYVKEANDKAQLSRMTDGLYYKIYCTRFFDVFFKS